MMPRKTPLYYVIGDPVAHSLSPLIMNRALGEHRCDGVYEALRVGPEQTGRALEDMRAQGVRGANVTYPLKERVLDFADQVSAAARAIGAANLLSFADGRITAENTDAPGTAAALETFGGTAPAGTSVVIVGAGGAGRAAAWGLLEKGAREVTFALRDPKQSDRVCARFTSRFPGRRIGAVGLGGSAGPGELDQTMEKADVIINATPVGMTGGSPSSLALNEDVIHEGQTWFDFVYHPQETAFLAAARRGGARALGGLALLVSQAREGFRVWTGHEFSLVEMYEYVSAHLAGADAAGQR